MLPAFDHPPTPEVLIALVNGPLNQAGNLSKALRLWTILQSLYGEDTQTMGDRPFTSAQWRDRYYPQGYPSGTNQDTLSAALDFAEWRVAYDQRYPRDWAQLEQRLSDQPFQVSDRTLRNDFASLVDLGWLTLQGSGKQRQYQCVNQLPRLDSLQATPTEITTEHLIPNHLPRVVDLLFEPINGEQRFILDIENVMPSELSTHLEPILQQLKQLWQAAIVPPIRLGYRSARRYQDEFELITYPVCIHYCQRAPYLFAFGQTPNTLADDQPNLTEWYDYRLDHILRLTPLDWSQVPPSWLPRQGCQGLPPKFADKTPQRVWNEVSQALGFEIYRPLGKLLLRFDRYFFANYIAGTEREKDLTQVSFPQAQRLFEADRAVRQADLSLQTLFLHRPAQRQDVFCLLDHRVGDNHVVMRLRAWGPKVEVLLPLVLRQRMQADLATMQGFYQLPGD